MIQRDVAVLHRLSILKHCVAEGELPHKVINSMQGKPVESGKEFSCWIDGFDVDYGLWRHKSHRTTLDVQAQVLRNDLWGNRFEVG